MAGWFYLRLFDRDLRLACRLPFVAFGPLFFRVVLRLASSSRASCCNLYGTTEFNDSAAIHAASIFLFIKLTFVIECAYLYAR